MDCFRVKVALLQYMMQFFLVSGLQCRVNGNAFIVYTHSHSEGCPVTDLHHLMQCLVFIGCNDNNITIIIIDKMYKFVYRLS